MSKPTPDELDRGLVWVFPGIEGGRITISGACRGLRDAGVDSAIEIFDWQRGLWGALANLTAYAANRRRAAVTAERIVEYHNNHPDAPIDLVGYSGGGGIAIMVAEALPPGVPLRNVVLVQAAISQRYDLTCALSHIDGHLVNVYSPRDYVMLGIGTYVFGTMDRVHEAAAGKNGFAVEAAIPDPTLRRKLVQAPWRREMLCSGHYGGHFAILLRGWNRRFVAPYVREHFTVGSHRHVTDRHEG